MSKMEVKFTDCELGCISDLIENDLGPYGHACGDTAYYLRNALQKINEYFKSVEKEA